MPLPDQFRVLKASLVEGREEIIKASWDRLLKRLKVENDIVAQYGSKVIPEVQFDHLDEELRNSKQEIQKRGAVVVRGIVPEEEARGYKFELDEYIRKNPQTKGETSHTSYKKPQINTYRILIPRSKAFPPLTPKYGNSTGPRPNSAPASTQISCACKPPSCATPGTPPTQTRSSP